MHVSKFNYLSAHEGCLQKLLMNFLTQSADIVDSESAGHFLGGFENDRHPDIDREYVQKRGYVFSNMDQELQIMRALYEYELKNAVAIYVAHLDTFGKKKPKYDEILKSINEIERKKNNEPKLELVLYNENSLNQFTSIQYLEGLIKECNSLNMNTKIVTTPETLPFFRPLLSKELVADITLICPFPDISNPTFFVPHIEEILDKLIEHEKSVTLDLKMNIEDIKHLKPLVNYLIYKGWPILENFRCRLVPVDDESCYFGYCYNNDIKLAKDIFEVFRTHRQTEFCSMEKWIGINNVHALIWQGIPPRPSFHFCDASLGLTVFAGDGNIFPCLKLAEASRETTVRIKAGFEDFRQRNGMMLSDCQGCRYTVSCGGGCSYKSLIQNNGKVCCPPIKDLIEVSLETYFDEFLEKIDFLEEHQRGCKS